MGCFYIGRWRRTDHLYYGRFSSWWTSVNQPNLKESTSCELLTALFTPFLIYGSAIDVSVSRFHERSRILMSLSRNDQTCCKSLEVIKIDWGLQDDESDKHGWRGRAGVPEYAKHEVKLFVRHKVCVDRLMKQDAVFCMLSSMWCVCPCRLGCVGRVEYVDNDWSVLVQHKDDMIGEGCILFEICCALILVLWCNG